MPRKLKKRICVACNEDGYGPSAFAFYVVRELARIHEADDAGFELLIVVLNNSAYEFNLSLYGPVQDVVQPVRLQRDSLIRLCKRVGEVDVCGTLRSLLDYERAREEYFRAVRPYLFGCDVALDIGVPLFAASAKRLDVKHRITLFDHSWARTLRLVSNKKWRGLYKHNQPPTTVEEKVADAITREIERDERCATEVILFDKYIAPKVFHDHWKRLRVRSRTLGRVLGKRTAAADALRLLRKMVAGLGQDAIPDGKPLVLVAPGGTLVWAELLPTIVDGFIRGGERAYMPVLSAPRAVDEATTARLKEKMRRDGGERIRWFDFVPGSTQQAIMSAFDLVVSRAGGGTVNDALASEVPLVCVEERQVQVILIEKECLRQKLILDVPETRLDKFRADPVGCIDAFFEAMRQASGSNGPGKGRGTRKKQPRGGAERAVAQALYNKVKRL